MVFPTLRKLLNFPSITDTCLIFCIHTWYNWCISASVPDTTDVSLHPYLIQLMHLCIRTWYNWCISASIPDTTDASLHQYLIQLMYFCINTCYNWCISAWWWALLFSFLNAQLSATTQFRYNCIIIRFCLNCLVLIHVNCNRCIQREKWTDRYRCYM